MDLAETTIASVILPMQFFAGPRAEAWTPERRLMAAVLEEAVVDYRTARRVTGVAGQRLRAEIGAWFRSHDASGPFSFLTICAVLDLEPSSVRAALARPSVPRDGSA